MKLIDLHVHSTASDGTFTPEDLALYAHAKGLSAIALTDHDTIDGVIACQQKGLEVGLTVIPGIEFSADFYGKEVHILGYFIDPHSHLLKEKLKELVEARHTRNMEMLYQLAILGCPITLEELYEGCEPTTILTRAHFAKALLKKGYITQLNDAFSLYIGQGKPAYIAKKQFTTQECIDIIHSAEGLAVLAHPMLYGYDSKDVTNLLRGLKGEGLDGVECLYATHTTEQTQHLLQVCSNLNLFPTGGSDFHGKNKPNLDLGSGYGNLVIPADLLNALHEHLV